MSQDWKKQTEEKLQRERLSRHQEVYPTARELEAAYEYREQQLKAEMGRKFRCWVCDKAAEKPGSYEVDEGLDAPNKSEYTWNSPGDLSTCKLCDHWTCDECLLHEVCQKCWNKHPNKAERIANRLASRQRLF